MVLSNRKIDSIRFIEHREYVNVIARIIADGCIPEPVSLVLPKKEIDAADNPDDYVKERLRVAAETCYIRMEAQILYANTSSLPYIELLRALFPDGTVLRYEEDFPIRNQQEQTVVGV